MKKLKQGIWLSLIAALFILQFSQISSAQTPLQQFDVNGVFGNWPTWVIPGSCSSTPPSRGPGPNSKQIAIAEIIMGIAKTDFTDIAVAKQAAFIGLITAIDESGLQVYANSKLPISLTLPFDVIGNDGDSVGVFQQQPQFTWSVIDTGALALTERPPIAQLMDPAYSAEAFFGSPPGATFPPNSSYSPASYPAALKKGLQNISPNWQTLPPDVAAQKVQNAGAPHYANYFNQATDLLNQYWSQAAPVALPVPFNGSGGGTSGPPPSSSGSCTSGNPSPGGCINPFAADLTNWDLSRTDQGVDYRPHIGGLPVKAICDGTVVGFTTVSGWPFDDSNPNSGLFLYYKLTSAPVSHPELIGKCIYVAEKLTLAPGITVGKQVSAGDTIALTVDNGYAWTEWGWAAGQNTPADRNLLNSNTLTLGGESFARFMKYVIGAPVRDDPGAAGPLYYGNSCP
jgi:hypothetical protein